MPGQQAKLQPRALHVLQAVVLTVAILYFGKPVLVPFAVAVLLAFLLTPVVNWFERRRFPRVPAVMTVTGVIVLVVSAGGWAVWGQLVDLAHRLPTYEGNLKTKIVALRDSGEGLFSKLRQTANEVSQEIEKDGEDKQDEDSGPPQEPEDEPQEAPLVRVAQPEASTWDMIKATLFSAAAPAATVAIVFVLVVFMLIAREELRNRIVRLAGTRKISLTTKTLDDVERRISRYLLMNALVNGGFGVAVGTGLLLMGVDYAILWGFLAATLRFLPYIGPIVASVLPVAMAFLQSPGWTLVIMVVVYYIVLELVTNNLIEPLAYGRSAGVSTMAVLVAATFWTWIWGPIGLFLSVPMTVVLAVLGKNIAQLESLGILLGDEPALESYVNYYQRLLAGDQEEAAEILEERLEIHSPVEVYDSVVIPALVLAQRDHKRDELTEDDLGFVWQTTHEFIDDLFPAAEPEAPAARNSGDLGHVYLVGCPAHDRADELALEMLETLLAPAACELSRVGRGTLVSEILESFAARFPDVVCISALGRGGVGQARYLVKRIRLRYPDLRIVVGRWGFTGDRERMATTLKSRGASQVVTTLAEACEAVRCGKPVPSPAAGVSGS